MKRLIRLLGYLAGAAVASAAVQTSFNNLQMKGASNELGASATLTLQSTATLTAASGSAVNLSAGTVTYPVGQLTDAGGALANKPSVKAVAVANVASLSSTTTTDGLSMVAGDLILLTAQSTGAQNGPWIVQSSTWTRPDWFPTGGTSQAFKGAAFIVRGGTSYSGSFWDISTSGAITIGTTTFALTQRALTLTSTSVVVSAGFFTDSVATLSNKPAVKVVGTANIASLSGTTTIDSVALVAGDTVLLTAQSTASQNGPWTVQSSTWTRPTWYPAAGTAQAFYGAQISALLGTLRAGSVWYIATTGAITIDTTSVTFTQRGSPASGVTAGTYGDATHAPQIAIDAAGRITSASNVTISGGGGGGGALTMLLVSDVKSSTTAGGTPTINAWTTRTLNTIDVDTAGTASISSNAITVPAGTYRVRARAPFYQCKQARIRLFDQTNSAVLVTGSSHYTETTTIETLDAALWGRFTVAGSTAIRVEYFVVNATGSTSGLGVATSTASTSEIYTQIWLEKE